MPPLSAKGPSVRLPSSVASSLPTDTTSSQGDHETEPQLNSTLRGEENSPASWLERPCVTALPHVCRLAAVGTTSMDSQLTAECQWLGIIVDLYVSGFTVDDAYAVLAMPAVVIVARAIVEQHPATGMSGHLPLCKPARVFDAESLRSVYANE